MSASLLLPSPLHTGGVEGTPRSPYGTCPPVPTHSSSQESHLIMPSFLTFLRPSPPRQGIQRDASLRSLTTQGDPKSPEPLIRKCHTVITLSSNGSSAPHSTKIVRDKKSKNGTKTISSSKSAIFSTNRPFFIGLPKSPSAAVMRDTSSSAQYDDTLPKYLSGSSSTGCSRCASTASLASQRVPSCPLDSIFCKLCLSDVPIQEVHQLQQCECRFCRDCMSEYTMHKLQEGEGVIECPDSNCDCEGEVTADEVETLVEHDLYRLFLKLKVNREVALDPMRTWCPNPGCETVILLTKSKLDPGPLFTLCPRCKVSICASCSSLSHPGRSCHSVPNEVSKMCHNNTIKMCPRCKVMIERDAGCAQMQCKKCKHVFCWYCLASLEDDFLLRHYDKGPCKNKLGHSRASVLWHRAQVIGIFAGFGLLLVVASPILLFVGPCILCCRCKPCAKQELEEESLYGI